MMGKKFIHVDKYGILPNVIDNIFNRESLKLFKSKSGIPFDKKSESYMQFLRKGLPWTQGMFSNLMDVCYLLLFKRDKLSYTKEEKVERIISKLVENKNFTRSFELAADGYIAYMFSQKNAENPIEAFFEYLRKSPVWHDEIILPILSIKGLFSLQSIMFVLFIAEESDINTNIENYSLKLSSKKFYKEQEIIFLIKKRVTTEIASQADQWWVQGGYNYEMIVFLYKGKNELVKEVQYFVTTDSKQMIDDMGKKEVFSMVKNITSSFISWIKLKYQATEDDNIESYYITLEDIVNVMQKDKNLKIGGQLIDIMYRCTNILLIYKNINIWIPIYPRKIIKSSPAESGTNTGGETRQIQAFYFSNDEDRNLISNFIHDLPTTLDYIEKLGNVFVKCGVEWKYRPRSLIQRVLQPFSVTQVIERNIFITGIRLNKYAYLRVERIESSDKVVKQINLPIDNTIVDNFTYDYYINNEIRVMDELHMTKSEDDQKRYEWEIIQYLFYYYLQEYIVNYERKKLMERISKETAYNILKDFVGTMYFTKNKTHYDTSLKTFVLNENAVRFFKKLYMMFLENEFYRFSILYMYYPWNTPKKLESQIKNRVTFVFSQ